MAYGPKDFLLSLSHKGLQFIKPGRAVPNRSLLLYKASLWRLGAMLALCYVQTPTQTVKENDVPPKTKMFQKKEPNKSPEADPNETEL